MSLADVVASNCGAVGFDEVFGAVFGASPTIKCTLVPLMPNALIPAKRSSAFHGTFSSGTSIG